MKRKAKVTFKYYRPKANTSIYRNDDCVFLREFDSLRLVAIIPYYNFPPYNSAHPIMPSCLDSKQTTYQQEISST